MILAIDMGNTNIVIGCIEGNDIVFEGRMNTDRSKTGLEYAISLKTILEIYKVDPDQINGAIISSVVPSLNRVISKAIRAVVGVQALIVGPGIKTGLNILMDDPRSIGADLIVDAVAGIEEYGAPLIIIDMGTATTITVIDQKKNYIGGMIVPGVRTALGSLVKDTSLLPSISLENPKRVVAKNTIDAMESGIILGNAAMLDGLIERIEEETGYSCKVIATGGIAGSVVKQCKHEIIVDGDLLLKGLNILYRKNQE